MPARTVRSPVIRPSAGEILRGSDAKIVELRKEVALARRTADRQTVKARELVRRLRESEASIDLKAENDRLRSELADYLIALGIFANGDQVLGNRLAQIVAPTAGKLASHVVHDPDRLTQALSERAGLRHRYVYDMRGHRVRADQVNENNECRECLREIRRESKRRSA